MNVNCVNSLYFMAKPNKNLAKKTTEKVTETAKKVSEDFKPQNPLDSYLASRQQVNIKPVENPDVFYNSRNAVASDAVDPNAGAIESFLKSRGQ